MNSFERDTGVEPATYSLGSCHSTTELIPRHNGQGDFPRGRSSCQAIHYRGIPVIRLSGAALSAYSENFQSVACDFETVGLGDAVLQAFNPGVLEFDDGAAMNTDKMIVV